MQIYRIIALRDKLRFDEHCLASISPVPCASRYDISGALSEWGMGKTVEWAGLVARLVQVLFL